MEIAVALRERADRAALKISRRLRCAAARLALSAALLLGAGLWGAPSGVLSNLAAAGAVNYVYDSLGRLTIVYDAAGDAAVYEYDAVGNLLSIANYSAAQFSGLQLSSSGGLPGASLTIYGTDFCTNPTVTFNGVAATVTSANSTQIVVTVPSGASSGPVVVTCGSNQTTVGTFTVGGSAPTIAGFTPTVGAAGTAVTVSGTNFQTPAANNYVQFNATPAQVSAATATSLTTAVPSGAASGPITVTTSHGQAVSGGIFYVPLSGYSATNTIFGTITADGSQATENLTNGQAVMLTFNAVSGQQVSLLVTYNNFGGGCYPNAGIEDPYGNIIESNFTCSGAPTLYLDTITLRATGTYTVFVNGGGPTNSSLAFNLYTVVNNLGALPIGGPPVNFTDPTPGENPTYQFSGAAGQSVVLNLSNATYPCCNNLLSILNPDGSTLISGLFGTSYYNLPGIGIGPVPLPTTGTYSAVVNPNGGSTGNGTLQLWNLTNLSATVNTSDAYGAAIVADGPEQYWRLDESAMGTAANAARSLAYDTAGPTTPDGALAIQGPATLLETATVVAAPSTYTLEIWFKTTSVNGGTLIGMTNTPTTNPSAWDRALYLNDSGNLVFGVWNPSLSAVSSIISPGAYNDGNWHYVAGTYTNNGPLTLYVDGAQVAVSGAVANNPGWNGYWHVGWTAYASNWPSVPATYFFQGALAQAAIWDGAALTATQIAAHYNAAGGGNYDATVLADSPSSYWKLNESSGSSFADATGGGNTATAQIFAPNGQYQGNVTFGQSGAISTDSAVTLDGVTGAVASVASFPNPIGQPFSEEVWFKTTTTAGGALLGFNSSVTGVPGSWDRTLYMTNSGTLEFGIWNGNGVTTVASAAVYNDGAWHHAVGVCTPAQQLILYVDGAQVAASATGINDDAPWVGYWHAGYNNFAGNWPAVPNSYFFAGSLDEPAIYAYALSATQVANHYHASGR